MESENKTNDSHSSGWLEPLKRNSWEMELLLTGFVLIGLLQLPEYLEHLQQVLEMRFVTTHWGVQNLINLPIGILYIGSQVMTVSLIILLLLRGYWIGLVGLSSAFPKGINHKKLSFTKHFSYYLQKKSMDTEPSIVRLDNICSSVFAFSFLFIFITISIGLFFIQLSLIGFLVFLVSSGVLEGRFIFIIVAIILGFVILIYLLGGLLKVIDFLTIGKLKRIKAKWFSRPYYLISSFISYVTLAFSYRSIYYYLASNVPKRIIKIVFLIYIIVPLSVFFGFQFHSHIFFPYDYLSESNRDAHSVLYENYENLRNEDNNLITKPIIQSEFIKGDYVKLFIPYDVNDNEKLMKHCRDLKPLGVNFSTSLLKYNTRESFIKQSLECFSSFYTISVDDSVYNDVDFYFHEHRRNNEPGIITYISVKHLLHGHHKLDIQVVGNDKQTIQFWKE